MEPPLQGHAVLTAVVATSILVAMILTAALVGSTVLQQRRYLRTREHFGGRVLAVQDEERAAIARELHDDVVQRLIMLAAELRQDATPHALGVAARLDRVADELRGLARGVHPSVVDHVGIGEALRQLAGTIEEREGITVELVDQLATDTLQPGQRLALYRVAQEALGNAARHAGVDRVRVRIGMADGDVQLTVSDDGSGFDPSAAAAGPGIGLTSMRERLAVLGGLLTLDTAPGQGTTVTAYLPLESPR